MIDPDDFSAWRDNPISQAHFAAMKQWALDCRERWVRDSWDGAVADPLVLHELRGQAFACEKFAELTLDEMEAIRGETPDEDGQ